VKLNVVSKETGPDLPPSLGVGSIDIKEQQVYTEAKMVQELFAEFGPGNYLIEVNQPPKNKYHKVWEGEIKLEDSERLLYKAEVNVLDDLTPLETKQSPRTGKLKRIRLPDDLVEKIGIITGSEQHGFRGNC